jgi:polar amino acid transport system ATP-binding protein
MSEALLQIVDVHKSFGTTEVLRGVHLEVARNEVIALIGSSGSGKSTLLKVVNLLEPVDDGRVLLDGSDITDPRVEANAVRADIGVVFQQFNLFPHLSVLANVTLAARHVHGWSRAAADERGRELLAEVGLADKARDYPDRLSGGQQQRVAIARAIATEPKLLLLDEITSALDPELVGEVLELIRRLAHTGTTILMATHEMGFARDVADRVAFLDQGVVAELGTPAEVLLAPQLPRTQAFLSRLPAG